MFQGIASWGSQMPGNSVSRIFSFFLGRHSSWTIAQVFKAPLQLIWQYIFSSTIRQLIFLARLFLRMMRRGNELFPNKTVDIVQEKIWNVRSKSLLYQKLIEVFFSCKKRDFTRASSDWISQNNRCFNVFQLERFYQFI